MLLKFIIPFIFFILSVLANDEENGYINSLVYEYELIKKSDIERILSSKNLEVLSLYNCEFEDIDFDSFNDSVIIPIMYFYYTTGGFKLPKGFFKVIKVKILNIVYSTLDISNITTDDFSHLEEIQFRYEIKKDYNIDPLKNVPRLMIEDVYNSINKNENLEVDIILEKMKDIKELKIVGGTKVTQSIIDKIASLTKLEKLYIEDSSCKPNCVYYEPLCDDPVNLSDLYKNSKLEINISSFGFKEKCIVKATEPSTTTTTTTEKQKETSTIKKHKNKKSHKKHKKHKKHDNKKNLKCGKKHGKCPTGYCCNKHGWCGKTKDYCSKSIGCQSKYGKCKLNK